jgi:hypothetical protein
MSSFHQACSRFLPALLTLTLGIAAGPATLRALAETALCMAQISLEFCQMGIAVLRVWGV